MASSKYGEGMESFWVDKDGVPHWDGSEPARFLKQYKARVSVEFEANCGTTDQAKERRATMALRLTRGLTGKAWDLVEPLLADMGKLKTEGGHKLIVAALDTLDKEAVLRKQEKFDDFFKRSWRKPGQEMADYIREKEQKYMELSRLDSGTTISDDLYAYFLLEGARLKEDQKKLVTMVADNEFDTKAFVKTLRTSFHDVHVGERRGTGAGPADDARRPFGGRFPRSGGHGRGGGGFRRFGGHKRPAGRGGGDRANWVEEDDEDVESEDEANLVEEEGYEEAYGLDDDEEYSDLGADEDEEVAEAYAAYEQARTQLRDQQKRRGFFKASGTLTFEERKAAIKKEKTTTSCAACGQKGHWAGDPECPKGSGKGGGGGKDRKHARFVAEKGRAAMRAAGYRGSKKRPQEGSFFVLDDADYLEGDAFVASASPSAASPSAPPLSESDGSPFVQSPRQTGDPDEDCYRLRELAANAGFSLDDHGVEATAIALHDLEIINDDELREIMAEQGHHDDDFEVMAEFGYGKADDEAEPEQEEQEAPEPEKEIPSRDTDKPKCGDWYTIFPYKPTPLVKCAEADCFSNMVKKKQKEGRWYFGCSRWPA